VPVAAPEAAAWRALEFGLVPARGRLAVLDPVAGEAAVVDRDGELLVAVGPAVTLDTPAACSRQGAEADGAIGDGVPLVALARRALDAAPAGPPFAGILLAGALPGADADGNAVPGADADGSAVPGADADGSGLPALVARITGRAPLVPGDPTRVAVLGAAALGWAAARAAREGPGEAATTPAGRSPTGPPGVVPVPASERGRPLPAALEDGGSPGSPHRRHRLVGPGSPAGVRRPRRLLGAAAIGLLVVIAIVAGLGWHRSRTTPSPFTYTCPDGQVVAYRAECPTLAPP
jgi:hypothetical protein